MVDVVKVTYVAQVVVCGKIVSLKTANLEVFTRAVDKLRKSNPARKVYMFTVTDSTK